MQPQPTARAFPSLTEPALLIYLLLIPFAQQLPPWLRDLPIWALLLGMVIPRLPLRISGPRPAAIGMLGPFLIFAATTCTAILFSAHRDLSILRASYAPVGFLAFFAVQDALTSVAPLRRISLALTAVLFLVGLDGLTQAATGETLFAHKPLYADRVVAGMPHPNDLALLALLLPFPIALATAERSLAVRAFVLLALVVAIPTAIASQSRNTWIGLCVAALSTLALARNRKPALIVAGLALLAGLAAALLDGASFGNRLATLTQLSQEGRIGVWLAGWEMFEAEPVFGVGLHTFAEAYGPHLERATLPAGYEPELAYMPWAHNLYLEMLAERGVVGLAGFLVPVVAMLRCLRTALAERGGDEAARPYAVAVAASLAAFLVMGLFDLTFLKDWVLLLFWLIAGMSVRLEMLCGAREAGPPPPEE